MVPEIHKQGKLLRPLMCFVSFPAYLLARFSDRWYKSHVSVYDKRSVQNSVDRTSKIKYITLVVGGGCFSRKSAGKATPSIHICVPQKWIYSSQKLYYLPPGSLLLYLDVVERYW